MKEHITKKILTIGLIFLLFINLFSYSIISTPVENSLEKNSDLPSVFSWRNINETDFTTPVKNQGGLKTDAAFSLIATLETMVQYKIGYPFYCDLSEAHLFFNCNGSTKKGVDISKCANYLVKYGVPDEGCFPYPERSYDPDVYYNNTGWNNRSVNIKNWKWIENDISSIKYAIYENGPVCVLVNTSSVFLNHKKDIFKSRGKVIDVQWVNIVGYNDDKGHWICKNSWGKNWGENGWFKMPYNSKMITNGEYLKSELIPKNCTGIISLKGVFGNLKPDVPIVKIYQPGRGLTYRKIGKIAIFRDVSWFLDIPFLTENFLCNFYQKFFARLFPDKIIDPRTPRVKKSCIIEICAVRFVGNASVFIDDKLFCNFTKTTFYSSISIDSKGLHSIRAEAENEDGLKSSDIREFKVI